MDRLQTAIPEITERRNIFTYSEKVCLQKLIHKYKLNCISGLRPKDIIAKRHAWARVTQEFNSIDTNSCRTTAQLKKCWDNIKTRGKQALSKRLTTGPVQDVSPNTEPENSDDVDPLDPVKNEHNENNDRLCWSDDEDDNHHSEVSNEFLVADPEDNSLASVEVPSPLPRQYPLSVNGTSQPEKGPKSNCRSEQREEELHKLKVAEKMWLLKTLKEQHRKAQLDREKAQLERERAQIERDKAQCERDKAQLELNRAIRADADLVSNS